MPAKKPIRSNVIKGKSKFKFKWWMAAIGVGVLVLFGALVLRFSNASTNGKADFKVDSTSDFSVAILQAKNGASVEVNSCLYLNDAYGGVEQVRVWYRRLAKDPQDPNKKVPLYDGYYSVSSNQVPSQLQYGGTWLDNNQSANSYLPEKTFNVNFPDLYFNKYKSGDNKNQKIYVGLFYGTNPFSKDITNPSQKDTDFVNNAILARGGQAISVNQLKLCLNSPNQKLANKQAVPKKINGTKSNETRLNRDGDPPYSKSLEGVTKSKSYIGTIPTKYAGNIYVTACARNQGGSIFTVDSAAWFADPRYVAWGKFGTSSDFWIKNNGTEVAGPTSGKWAYGVVASLNTQAIDYSSSTGLEFGITDYNTFASPPLLDVASLKYDMSNLKMCDTGKAIPAKSNYIVPSITGNSQQTINQANTSLPNDSYPLRLGSSGTNVAYIQSLLGVTADGNFGEQTYNAVVSYQSANGLVPDGIVGDMTLASLQGNLTSYVQGLNGQGPQAHQCIIWYKSVYGLDIGNYRAADVGLQYENQCKSIYDKANVDFKFFDPRVYMTAQGVAPYIGPILAFQFNTIAQGVYLKDHWQWNGVDH